MTSDGLYISRFIWQVMAYIYQDLYDHSWLIYIYIYIYQDLYDMWWHIYIKVYMTSDGLDISKFMSQVMAYIYEDLYL